MRFYSYWSQKVISWKLQLRGKQDRITSANRERLTWEITFPRSFRFQNISYLHAQLIEDKTSRVVEETMPFPAEFYDTISVVMRYYWGNTNRKAGPQPHDMTGKLRSITAKIQRI